MLPVFDPEEIRQPLLLLRRSLIKCGQAECADGPLTDTIRRLAAFGSLRSCIHANSTSSVVEHHDAHDAFWRNRK